MNTLYPDLLQKKIHSWNEMQKLILSLEKNAYPQEIEGIQNGLYGFFIS